MRIIDRYIAVTVACYVIAALFVLVILQMAFGFLDEMGDVGKGSYTAGKAAYYIAMTTPNRVYEMFPLAALIGSLLGLGAMAGSSELTIIRASGVSVYRIVFSVIKIGIILSALTFTIGEWLSPPINSFARSYRADAISERLSVTVNGSFWLKDGDRVVSVRQAISKDVLADIVIYRYSNDRQLQAIISAPKAQHSESGWVLADAAITRFNRNGVTVDKGQGYIWHGGFQPENIEVVSSRPDYLSLKKLWEYIGYQQKNGLESAKYELAFWNKLASPFSTMVMLIISIPFVFGSLRSVGTGQRLMLGIVLGIGYFLISRILSTSGVVYELNPVFCAFFPLMLFLFPGLFAIYRVE